eukprot:317971-Rhodomonas_salina.1
MNPTARIRLGAEQVPRVVGASELHRLGVETRAWRGSVDFRLVQQHHLPDHRSTQRQKHAALLVANTRAPTHAISPMTRLSYDRLASRPGV